jgi:hypothetical protein
MAFARKPLALKLGGHVLGIVGKVQAHRDDGHLLGSQPHGKAPAVLLEVHAEEALYGA